LTVCFQIDAKAPRWTNRYVWKRVTKDGLSPYKGVAYISRTIVRARGRNYRDRGWSARAGIYVYRIRAEAVAASAPGDRVIRLRVRPCDFLYSNGRNTATYKQVRTGRV